MTLFGPEAAVLLGTQASSARMSERANRMALAALLARSKMIDLEGELMSEGFSDMTETANGDFRDEGADDMEWEALIEVIEITPDAEETFNAEVYTQLFGDGEAGGSLTGSSSVSSFLPMILAQVPEFINQVAQRARKITLVISWEEGEREMSLTVQQYVVNMRPGGAEVDLEPISGQVPTNALQGQAIDPLQGVTR